jgi:predicted nuclease of restriction endonuclease-like (RecB) superfamily
VNFPTPPTRAAVPDWYPDLLDAVANCVQTGRQRAVSAANQELVSTYWAVGAEILARQDAEGWGTRVIDRLSADLRERFPGTSGFSPRSLKYMRAFTAAWPDFAIVQRSVAQLPWRHNVALLDKLDTAEMRLWYAEAAIEQGWSRDVLVHHIEGRFHERAGRAITNFARVLPPPESDLAQQSTRDPYLFDFVGNADIRRERDLERALIDHVERFLLELGQGFAFVGKQLHLEIGDADFYADLLFYHLKLRCFVVVELKVGDFDPSYLGQLGMYMSAVDDRLRHADDKLTIGLLLCKTKNNVVAEYALRVTPRPSESRSGRRPSPSACPQNSNPACPQSKNSKPSWPASPAAWRTTEKTNDRIQ